MPTYTVQMIGPNVLAFLGKLTTNELQAYRLWMIKTGHKFDGWNWIKA